MKEDRIKTAFAEIRADDALLESTAAYLRQKIGKRQGQGRYLTFPKIAGAFAAAAAIICIFVSNLYFSADAYVGIDVNPSIELTLNRFNRVIDTYAFNKDASRILNDVSLRGKTYDEAAGALIAALNAEGYLAEDSLVSVTVRADSENREQSLCDALQRFISGQMRSVKATAEIEVFPVTAEAWGNAHGCNVSPAKYLAIQELIEIDAEATIESYSNSTIRQIRRRTQECHDERGAGYGGNYNSGTSSGHGHAQGGGHGHGR